MVPFGSPLAPSVILWLSLGVSWSAESAPAPTPVPSGWAQEVRTLIQANQGRTLAISLGNGKVFKVTKATLGEDGVIKAVLESGGDVVIRLDAVEAITTQ
jgi:hypothetical protein